MPPSPPPPPPPPINPCCLVESGTQATPTVTAGLSLESAVFMFVFLVVTIGGGLALGWVLTEM